MTAILRAPDWIKSFYARFPLVLLDQEESLSWQAQARVDGPDTCVLWIKPPPASQTAYPWASSEPASLRFQLLLLQRQPPVRARFRSWDNEDAAPGGSLPALHLPTDNKLLNSTEIRDWLDVTHPLKGKQKELQGLPDQTSYDRALAVAQLVLVYLYPAYLASLPISPVDLHLHLSTPPPLAAGLTTPLPAAFTGDTRDVDTDEMLQKGLAAVNGLEELLSGTERWALGADVPSPLDALITSHVFVLATLPDGSLLRSRYAACPSLQTYVGRVMDHASSMQA